MPPPMSETHSLLLEIGCEELPSSYVDAALAALPALTAARLGELRLVHGAVKAYGTPRRLAVVVHDLADAQLDLDEEVTGPPETAAFKDGKPTKAAEAFAAKLGVAVEKLEVVEKVAAAKQKAGRFVVGRRVERGSRRASCWARRWPTCAARSRSASRCAGEPPTRRSAGRCSGWWRSTAEHLIDVAFAGVRSTASRAGTASCRPRCSW